MLTMLTVDHVHADVHMGSVYTTIPQQLQFLTPIDLNATGVWNAKDRDAFQYVLQCLFAVSTLDVGDKDPHIMSSLCTCGSHNIMVNTWSTSSPSSMPNAKKRAAGIPAYAKFVTATVTVSLYAEVSGCRDETSDQLRRDLAAGGFCGNIVEVRCCFPCSARVQMPVSASCRALSEPWHTHAARPHCRLTTPLCWSAWMPGCGMSCRCKFSGSTPPRLARQPTCTSRVHAPWFWLTVATFDHARALPVPSARGFVRWQHNNTTWHAVNASALVNASTGTSVCATRALCIPMASQRPPMGAARLERSPT